MRRSASTASSSSAGNQSGTGNLASSASTLSTGLVGGSLAGGEQDKGKDAKPETNKGGWKKV
jgi:hypothetical protein